MTFKIVDARFFVTFMLCFAVVTLAQWLLRLRTAKICEKALRLVYAEGLYERAVVFAAAKEKLEEWRPVLRRAFETTFAPNCVTEALVACEQEKKKK